MITATQIEKLTGLSVYPSSVSPAPTGGATYFLARRGREKLVGCVGQPCLPDAQRVGTIGESCVCVGPISHANAVAVRNALAWTAPRCMGLATSAGLGDRLGLATPGHVRAIRGTGLAAVLAQQSIREMTRTRRTPEQVMDCATWGVLQEGFADGFGSDADHLQRIEDIDATAAAGFTQFTIDPGQHVVNEADRMDEAALAETFRKLDCTTLQAAHGDLKALYAGKRFKLADGSTVTMDATAFLRAAVKYGSAIIHTVRMWRHLCDVVRSRAFELEVSVDETDSPTTPAEHFFFASELKRLGVRWVAMAPRFIGRFEKGVDYIGDLDEFRASFAQHVAVMRTVGPYKMSIHSGSDKFSIYPIVAELTAGLVHLKTAGTSYLEAVRAVGRIDPGLFREIYDFAREHYEQDRKTYHVSADMSKVPPASTLSDDELAGRIDDFHTRQALHCTFGSVLTADDGARFRTRLYAALESDEEAHYAALVHHLGRHLAPFVQKR